MRQEESSLVVYGMEVIKIARQQRESLVKEIIQDGARDQAPRGAKRKRPTSDEQMSDAENGASVV